MSYWYDSHDLLAYGRPIGLCQRGVTYTTNIPFCPWFCLPLYLLSLQ